MDIFELQEDPISALVEIQANSDAVDSSISEIIEHMSSLSKLPSSIEGKAELLHSLQTLLIQYKQLQEGIKPVKEIILGLIGIARQITESKNPVQINRNILNLSNEELTSLETQFNTLNTPTSVRDMQGYLCTVGNIRLNALTVENRVESLLPGVEGNEDLIAKSKEIIGNCNSQEKLCLENGWLSALLAELDSIVTFLTGVKGKVNHMNRQVNNAGKRLSRTDCDDLTEYQQELSDIPEMLNR